MARRRRVLRARYLVPLAILLVAVVTAAMLWRPAQPAGAIGTVPHTVERGRIEDLLLVSGLVNPSVTIEVRAEASGLVESALVEDGDRVSAGQVLVTLDSRVAQTAVEEAEAQLKQAELQLEASRLDLDEDTLALRRITHERNVQLHARGLVAQSEVEASQLQLRVAERALERARRNLATSDARIEQLRAQLEQRRAQLQHTIVRAPIDAWVIRRHVEVGSGVAGLSQSTSGGTVVATLGNASRASLNARVTAVDARRLRVGMDVRIRLDSDPDRAIPARVVSVSSAGEVDQQTRLTTFPIVIDVPTDARTAWINVPARAEIVVGVKEDVVVLPDHCLTTEPGGRSLVLLQRGGESSTRPVELGVMSEERVEVVSGLDAGDTILCRRSGV
jgi:multidrug efflux pump subunit AcrA (membrane-fusion protein)